jgi:deazaflavin-dependent oxidoreductase (nitroreductase family)
MSGRWYNPIMAWLLRSPLHAALNGGFMLITVTGRKSGKLYTTPVNYRREDGSLLIMSPRTRTWWRNLRDGAPVTVRLKGRDMDGIGVAITGKADVAASLARYFEQMPQQAKYFGVKLNSDGKPDGDDIARAAKERVLVRVQLN